MILNACVKKKEMVDENICKNCTDKNCRHAGEPITKERLDIYTYGKKELNNSMGKIKDKPFRDEKCTCFCGNTHELYGGKGYTTISCEAFSDGQIDGGFYRHIVKCNKCNKEFTLQF